jgi:endonuclease/exonuclease/phosphatase family metal-dependent hydrolase
MPWTIKVLSYNIWFDTTFLEARTHQIVRLIGVAVPDVICLQEVTPESFEILHTAFQRSYRFSDPPPNRGYFTTMMVRSEYPTTFSNVGFPSEMGRSLLVGEIKLCCDAELGGDDDRSADIMIATSHFESLSSRPLRRCQLEIAATRLKTFLGRWILCGDFNFCSYQNFRGRHPDNLENKVLNEVLPPHCDAWTALHPQPTLMDDINDGWRGYTFDSERNLNISHPERMRYDRVLVSSETNGLLQPSAVELFGTTPVDRDLLSSYPPDANALLELPQRAQTTDLYSTPPKALLEDLVVYPSDHFGLVCTLNVAC